MTHSHRKITCIDKVSYTYMYTYMYGILYIHVPWYPKVSYTYIYLVTGESWVALWMTIERLL